MLRTALKFILYDKPKSIGALAGAVLSVFLIGQQSGIFIFLTNAMGAFALNNTEYLWVVDDRTQNVNSLGQLDLRLGRQLESFAGVAKVFPLVVAAGSAKFPNGQTSGITLLGVQYPELAGGPWNLASGRISDLTRDGAVVTDYFDRESLGNAGVGDYFEINGKRVFVAAQTRGVRTFGGVVGFTTIERARYLTNVPTDKANAFLIRWQTGADLDLLIQLINTHLPGVRAWKAQDLARATILEVLQSSGIAISIGSLIVFALLIGFVIIGLTLYSAAIDRIRDYGTLKAIGATDGYVARLILMQAAIFAILGFALGYLLINGFQQGIAQAGTIFEFPLWLRFGFLGITLFIAFTGSLFAIRRIISLEPSAVFRG